MRLKARPTPRSPRPGSRQEPLCVRILLPSRCRRKCWLSQFSRPADKDRAKSKGKWQMANGKEMLTGD